MLYNYYNSQGILYRERFVELRFQSFRNFRYIFRVDTTTLCVRLNICDPMRQCNYSNSFSFRGSETRGRIIFSPRGRGRRRGKNEN